MKEQRLVVSMNKFRGFLSARQKTSSVFSTTIVVNRSRLDEINLFEYLQIMRSNFVDFFTVGPWSLLRCPARVPPAEPVRDFFSKNDEKWGWQVIACFRFGCVEANLYIYSPHRGEV